MRVGSSGRKRKTETTQPPASDRVVRRKAATLPDTDARTEVDLRGMTGDEAEMELLRAIDDAVVEGLSSLRVIHGKGTGALRQRVGEMLEMDKRVRSVRMGGPTEGGAGVTVASFGDSS